MSLPTKTEFLARVIDEITQGKALPLTPNPERLEKILQTAKRKFYDNDDRANQVEYILIKPEMFQTPLFIEKRQVLLPDCVIALSYLKNVGANYYNQNVSPDFQKTNFSYAVAVTGNSYDMLTAVTQGFYADFLRHFVVRDITYEFNPYTHMLTVIGRNPGATAVAEANVAIAEGGLYNIPEFFEWVCAECRINFNRIYTFVDAKQLGSYNLNLADMKAEAKEAKTEVIELWERQTQNNNFFFDF